ncbi:hypothetical protein DR999_PMT13994 [Platysternon megacephalum]|uniref:Uncharacterized protein n=1 Tax=Platysternon megacephalum TaxID=55544 RepID=A0A4D9E9Q7_9SAUR|nr:hypothetical protein DR999_PMT13994 [Platysternon megacephalum]
MFPPAVISLGRVHGGQHCRMAKAPPGHAWKNPAATSEPWLGLSALWACGRGREQQCTAGRRHPGQWLCGSTRACWDRPVDVRGTQPSTGVGLCLASQESWHLSVHVNLWPVVYF